MKADPYFIVLFCPIFDIVMFCTFRVMDMWTLHGVCVQLVCNIHVDAVLRSVFMFVFQYFMKLLDVLVFSCLVIAGIMYLMFDEYETRMDHFRHLNELAFLIINMWSANYVSIHLSISVFICMSVVYPCVYISVDLYVSVISLYPLYIYWYYFKTALKYAYISHRLEESLRPVKLRRVVLGYDCRDNWTEFRFDLSLNYRLPGVIANYSENKPTLVSFGVI